MKKILAGFISIIIFVTLGVLIMLDRSGDSLSIDKVSAQACTVPSQVQNVLVEFPQCTGDVCDFTRISCSWDAVTDATSYSVTVTQVETSTEVYNQTVDSGTTTINADITQNYTYQCDVAAVNSCGTGTAGTHSLFCAADALVDDPTPTPTTPPQPTATPMPTIPPTGGIGAIPAAVGISTILLSGAGLYFLRKH